MTMRLDLVRDNPEIQFPEDGPRFKFIFWAHSSENLHYVTPLLEECDIIANEVAYFSNQDGTPGGDSIWDDYMLLNAMLSGILSEEDIGRVCADADNQDTHVSLALNFEGSGKRIVPIDDFLETTQEEFEEIGEWIPGFNLFLDKQDYTDTIRQNLQTQINYSRRRENRSLRQLHDLAIESAESGKRETIGVLYGASHTPLFVATTELGAKTERHMVDSRHRLFPPLEVLQRRVRYGLDTVDSISDEEIRDACLLEMASIAVAITIGSAQTNDENYEQENEVARNIMKVYRSNRPTCIKSLLRLRDSLYDGKNPIKILRMRQAAHKIIKLAYRQS